MKRIVKNIYQKFTRPLTHWMKKEKLDNFIEPFSKYYGECYGREYIVKSNRRKIRPRFAIFIKQENRLRQTRQDLDELVKLKIRKVEFINFKLDLRNKKEEGISIFKILEKYG